MKIKKTLCLLMLATIFTMFVGCNKQDGTEENNTALESTHVHGDSCNHNTVDTQGFIYSLGEKYLTTEVLTVEDFSSVDDFNHALELVKSSQISDTRVFSDNIEKIAIDIPSNEALSNDNLECFLYVNNYMLSLSNQLGFNCLKHEKIFLQDICIIYDEEKNQYVECTLTTDDEHESWMLSEASQTLGKEKYAELKPILLKFINNEELTQEEMEIADDPTLDFLSIPHK